MIIIKARDCYLTSNASCCTKYAESQCGITYRTQA